MNSFTSQKYYEDLKASNAFIPLCVMSVVQISIQPRKNESGLTGWWDMSKHSTSTLTHPSPAQTHRHRSRDQGKEPNHVSHTATQCLLIKTSNPALAKQRGWYSLFLLSYLHDS